VTETTVAVIPRRTASISTANVDILNVNQKCVSVTFRIQIISSIYYGACGNRTHTHTHTRSAAPSSGVFGFDTLYPKPASVNWGTLWCYDLSMNSLRRCCCKPTAHCNKSHDPVYLLEKPRHGSNLAVPSGTSARQSSSIRFHCSQ